MSVLFDNVGPLLFFLTAFNSSGDHHFFPISCLSNISLKNYIMSNFLFKQLLMHLVEILLIEFFLEEPLTKHFSIKHKSYFITFSFHEFLSTCFSSKTTFNPISLR